MFETFISSRIRRTLFEHLLSHQTDRFYLRGLARELGLSISPLRRELKRLENSGMLKADQEGNMLFYTVNADSDLLLQLQHVSEPALPGVGPRMPQPQPIPRPIMVPQPAPPGPSLITAGAGRPIEAPSASPVECPAPTPQSTQVGVVSTVGQPRPVLRRLFGAIQGGVPSGVEGRQLLYGPMSHPALAAATGLGLVLMLVVVSLAYMTMTEQRLASRPAGSIPGKRSNAPHSPRDDPAGPSSWTSTNCATVAGSCSTGWNAWPREATCPRSKHWGPPSRARTNPPCRPTSTC